MKLLKHIGGIHMKHNNSIECTIGKCIHHSHDVNFCTLNQIVVSKDNGGISTSTSSAQCTNFKTS